MTSAPDFDLSGRWTGMYNYPSAYPPNGFEAVLSDLAGAIAGTIFEQDDGPEGGGGILESVIEGRRQGSAVTFTKMYVDVDRMPDAVFYAGTLDPDGNEISGRWEIPGDWAGTFLMIRSPGAGETAEAKAAVEIPT
jgi:hypothetical protein